MSQYIHKRHNVSIMLYHLVCPAKYRKVVFDEKVDMTLKNICDEISLRYEIQYLEIGTDKDHVHFLIQSVPMYSGTKIAQLTKSITAREIFKRHPEIRKQLWGGEFWSKGFYLSTVGAHGNENTISNYVKNQGKENEYKQISRNQLIIFE